MSEDEKEAVKEIESVINGIGEKWCVATASRKMYLRWIGRFIGELKFFRRTKKR